VFIHLSIYSFVGSLIDRLIDGLSWLILSFIHPSIYLFIYFFIDWLIYLFICSFIHWFVYWLIDWLLLISWKTCWSSVRRSWVPAMSVYFNTSLPPGDRYCFVISIVTVRIISIVIIIIILLRIVHQWLELENDTRAQLSLGLADRTHGAPPKIRRKIIRLAENPLVSWDA